MKRFAGRMFCAARYKERVNFFYYFLKKGKYFATHCDMQLYHKMIILQAAGSASEASFGTASDQKIKRN